MSDRHDSSASRRGGEHIGVIADGTVIELALDNGGAGGCFGEKIGYRYIDGGLQKTKNGDLPRKCKLAPRKCKDVEHKVDAHYQS